ncbi:questin oxidase family protein [Parvularcula maris]|uniref:Questin oxidase family protein n=1 Tax=Parvularcula maris TaxID=2965077 RepID=A0A9X2RK68_9PROT|nr:questin oxidase family protein [Parvularcula maris]MCQ8186646.1 questin oxidase family protein [Parvularcula maris]
MVTETYYKRPDYKASTHEWLARGRRWDIEYKGYLSNHLTHAWVVMGGVGAPDETFSWWEKLYTNQLEEDPSREPGDLEPPRDWPGEGYTVINRLNWRNNVQSTRVAFPAFRDFFDQELRENGLSQTLRTYLPALMPGLAGAALHPIIHTGWATDVESLNMLGEGLAYMATSYQPIATEPPHEPATPLWAPDGTDLIEATLSYLRQPDAAELTRAANEASETEAYRAVNRGGFQHRIMTYNDPELPLGQSLNDIGPLALPDIDEPLDEVVEVITAFAAASLLGSDNEFFVLHGLTSLHGVLAVLPHLEPEDRRAALVHWWRAVMATLVVQDRPGLDRTVEEFERWAKNRTDQPSAPLSSQKDHWWRETISSVLCSRDEHVPKAAYALWRWSAWGSLPEASHALFERSARNLVSPNASGEVHENLWFAKSFSEASKEKERRYD